MIARLATRLELEEEGGNAQKDKYLSVASRHAYLTQAKRPYNTQLDDIARDLTPHTPSICSALNLFFFLLRLLTAWEDLASGFREPIAVSDSSPIIPSRLLVYTVSLLPAEKTQPIAVPLAISEAGSYTLVLNRGKIPHELLSQSGETLAPFIAESLLEHDEDEEDNNEGTTASATASQWANALAASLLISLCRFVWSEVRRGNSTLVDGH